MVTKVANEELILLAKNGDENAKEQFFLQNRNFSFFIAQRYKNTGIPQDDLVSMCNVGMMKAYNTFDPTKKIKFATYASTIMNNEILMFLRKNKKHLGTMSMDMKLNVDIDGNELTLEDVLEDERVKLDDNLMRGALTDVVEGFKETLDDRERYVFTARLIEGRNQPDIANELGISQSYISRIVKKITKQLQKYSRQVGFSTDVTVVNKPRKPREKKPKEKLEVKSIMENPIEDTTGITESEPITVSFVEPEVVPQRRVLTYSTTLTKVSKLSIVTVLNMVKHMIKEGKKYTIRISIHEEIAEPTHEE